MSKHESEFHAELDRLLEPVRAALAGKPKKRPGADRSAVDDAVKQHRAVMKQIKSGLTQAGRPAQPHAPAP